MDHLKGQCHGHLKHLHCFPLTEDVAMALTALAEATGEATNLEAERNKSVDAIFDARDTTRE